ncbi:hypothetical protein GTZ97_13335 [Aquabacterium fontiphilum]|jgi:hypothetical protein|uniref:hypothetical protein n=1 Tax=Aquabacterium fontiphilum TaxID=450365 RepID=UPI00137854B2|nr:hypothetical protein [Aquabacterium fontiphilum]NBD21650.1 hypothetical protein [Aquabacterium fontiphilum]
MANVATQIEVRSQSLPLDLDKAGVMVGFVTGVILMLALMHNVPEASGWLGAAVVATSTWLGLRGAQAITRIVAR